MNRPVILAVKKGQDMRSLIVDCLEEFGHRVLEAANAAQALERLDGNPFTLVVLDIEMRGAGLRCLEAVRKRATCPIIALTGFGGTPVATGATACLEKPFKVDELRNMVAWVLGKDTPVTGLS